MGAIAFAGTGGGQNLCQSNWIRDKGFGMGAYVPRLTSPVTGRKEESPAVEGYVFPLDEANLGRWSRWWKFANFEQALTFVVVTVITIVFTSMLAHSTLFGRADVAANISFLRIEGEQLGRAVGPWFGTLFWVIGAFSLFAASVGVIDYTARLVADVLKWTYLRSSTVRESALYFWLVWGMVALGAGILLAGPGVRGGSTGGRVADAAATRRAHGSCRRSEGCSASIDRASALGTVHPTPTSSSRLALGPNTHARDPLYFHHGLLNQPMILLVISACLGGLMMFVYSILLLVLNRVALPAPLCVRSYRVGALLWSAAFFGAMSVLTVVQQVKRLL